MISDAALPKEKQGDGQTPTTPKPSVRVRSPQPSDVATYTEPAPFVEDPDGSAASGAVQEPLAGEEDSTQVLQMSDHKHSSSDAMDINDSADEQDGSDHDDDQDEDGSASRKKKGQRFFCTGYPPCNLSFTRSEHLARHIRKHTGERPFQCHCNRRFSRLDNLRQHAQTVHVNEEIPTDSLAATGTRYQRQIRTDRVRPAPRPRTSTMSSVGGHSRGHSRNLSTSSIGSNSSVYSNATDVRRRPPPLLMAGDNRPTTPPTYSHYAAHSPNDLSTPTSSTFPATPSSPNFVPALGSPPSISSRPPGETRTPGRRLSVPASYNPYYPYANPNGPAYGPGPAVPSTGASSIVTSPTASSFPQNSAQMSASDDWRRRTWHPSTYSNLNLNYSRPATSGLTYSQTPDAPQPAYARNAMSAAGQAPRLPGIESFDHVQHRPTTPPRRNPTPPQPNKFAPQQPLLAAPDIDGPRRRHVSHVSWDGSRRSQYPEIDDNGRPTTTWGQQTMAQIDQMREAQAHHQGIGPSAMGPPPQGINVLQQPQHMAKQALQLESASKRVKRSGNYSGPGSTYRTSPDSSSSDGIPTPGTSAAEIHPAIMGSQGYIEPQLLSGDTQHTVSRDKQMGGTHS